MVGAQSFTLLHLNVQSLGNKHNTIELFLNELNPSFVCLSEHWAKSDHLEQVSLSGYHKVSSFCRQNKLHGGTIILTKSNLISACKELPNICSLSVELSFECSAMSFDKDTAIICIYRSPSTDIDIFTIRLSYMLTLLVNTFKTIFICGDFNINKSSSSLNSVLLHDIIASNGLTSLCKEATRIVYKGNILTKSSIDYVITNINEGNLTFKNFDPGLSDHFAQLVTWKMPPSLRADNQLQTITFRKINDFSLTEFTKLYVSDLSFFETFYQNTFVNINAAYDFFWEHLHWCMEAAFPTCTKKLRLAMVTKLSLLPLC